MALRRNEPDATSVSVYLTDDDLDRIVQAYTVIAEGPSPFLKLCFHPNDSRIKIRLEVPLHPTIKHRCLRAELYFEGAIRDFACFNQGFEEPTVTLTIPGEIRTLVHLDTSKVTVPLPELPTPNY
jgi:hypothetical protein